MISSRKYLQETDKLSDSQFRVFHDLLRGLSVKDIIRRNRTLFTAHLTDEQAIYVVVLEIVDILGGIDQVEVICEFDCDAIPCTGKLRKILNIEPFEYKEESGITISRTMI